MKPKTFIFFIFAALATADLHDNCACHNGESYNWRITAAACEVYNSANYRWGGATYDAASGRADPKAKIAGKEWETSCREIAQSGFDCIDGQGRCYAARGDVRGRC